MTYIKLTKIQKLENLLARHDIHEEHYEFLLSQMGYVGNGIYTGMGFYTTDTRELLLLMIACRNDLNVERFID